MNNGPLVFYPPGSGGGGGGSGDVTGPGSSTDNALVRFDGTTGKIIQNSGITLDDDNNLVFRDAAASDNPRITLISDQEWVSPTHKGDLIRLQPSNDYFKAAWAFGDKTGVDKWAMVGHDYLASYSAALDKTFTNTDINTTTDVVTLTAHGWSTGDAVWLSVSTAKIADFPDGLYPYFRYFIRAVDANTIAFYRTSATAVADTNRLPLDNAHASATYTVTKNNWHHHVSIEMADASATLGSAGELHSRFAMNYDVYPGILRMVDLEVQVIDNPLKLLSTGNSEMQFGINPERSGRRFSFQRHNSSDEFRIVYYTSTGLSASAGLQMALSNGFIGLGGNPDASTYRLKVTGAIQATTSLDVGTTLTAGGNLTAAGDTHIVGSGAGTETILWVKSNNAAGTRAGNIRFTGEGTGNTQYRGGFLTYDPLNNFVILGTHDTADALTSSDIESIKLDRATGAITLNQAISITDAKNIVLGTTTGTKIGTSTTQKLGFFNATPVVQPGTYSVTNSTTDRSFDADAMTLNELADVVATLINDIKSVGLIG